MESLSLGGHRAKCLQRQSMCNSHGIGYTPKKAKSKPKSYTQREREMDAEVQRARIDGIALLY